MGDENTDLAVNYLRLNDCTASGSVSGDVAGSVTNQPVKVVKNEPAPLGSPKYNLVDDTGRLWITLIAGTDPEGSLIVSQYDQTIEQNGELPTDEPAEVFGMGNSDLSTDLSEAGDGGTVSGSTGGSEGGSITIDLEVTCPDEPQPNDGRFTVPDDTYGQDKEVVADPKMVPAAPEELCTALRQAGFNDVAGTSDSELTSFGFTDDKLTFADIPVESAGCQAVFEGSLYVYRGTISPEQFTSGVPTICGTTGTEVEDNGFETTASGRTVHLCGAGSLTDPGEVNWTTSVLLADGMAQINIAGVTRDEALTLADSVMDSLPG